MTDSAAVPPGWCGYHGRVDDCPKIGCAFCDGLLSHDPDRCSCCGNDHRGVTTSAAQRVTITQHVASPDQVHYARLWGGQWVARCDAAAGWTVPLIHHPKRADLITCPQCRTLRMADLGAVAEAEAFVERVRDGD